MYQVRDPTALGALEILQRCRGLALKDKSTYNHVDFGSSEATYSMRTRVSNIRIRGPGKFKVLMNSV